MMGMMLIMFISGQFCLQKHIQFQGRQMACFISPCLWKTWIASQVMCKVRKTLHSDLAWFRHSYWPGPIIRVTNLPYFLVKSQLKVLSSASPDLVLWLYYVYIYIFLSLLHELYCNILLLSAVAVFFVLIVWRCVLMFSQKTFLVVCDCPENMSDNQLLLFEKPAICSCL